MSEGVGRWHQLACAHLGRDKYPVRLLLFKMADLIAMFCFETLSIMYHSGHGQHPVHPPSVIFLGLEFTSPRTLRDQAGFRTWLMADMGRVGSD